MNPALEKVSDDDLRSELQRRKEANIDRLKKEIREMEKALAEKRREMEDVSGTPVAAAPVPRGPRRPSISDEELGKQIIKVLTGRKEGMNATDIGAAVDQHNIRISKFFKKAAGDKGKFKRQGTGRSTLYFLK